MLDVVTRDGGIWFHDTFLVVEPRRKAELLLDDVRLLRMHCRLQGHASLPIEERDRGIVASSGL